jgi:hypothetical protein
LPIDPRWIPRDQIELPKEERHEGILEDACPDAVQTFGMKRGKATV